jgi:hypothetical protein
MRKEPKFNISMAPKRIRIDKKYGQTVRLRMRANKTS